MQSLESELSLLEEEMEADMEAGAEAAASVFKKYGFEAYAGSRLD